MQSQKNYAPKRWYDVKPYTGEVLMILKANIPRRKNYIKINLSFL